MNVQLKQKKVKGIHQKKSIFRSADPLTCVLMWSVNYSISQLKHITPKPILLEEDFKSFFKIKVLNHFFDKENLPDNFKFKEYCPLVFQNIRQHFYIDDFKYLKSFTNEPPQKDLHCTKLGTLKTYDNAFLVKIISSEDVAEMHRILVSFHEHLIQNSSQTLLPNFLFMYRIIINDKYTYLLGIRNIYDPRITINCLFDLKGYISEKDADEKNKPRPLHKYTDIDFHGCGIKLVMVQKNRDFLLRTLSSDMEFLKSNNLIDYRILVGIGLTNSENPEYKKSGKPVQSDSSDETSENFNYNQRGYSFANSGKKQDCTYFFGIISILTNYRSKKKQIQSLKSGKTSTDSDAIKPEIYSKRIFDFISTYVTQHEN